MAVKPKYLFRGTTISFEGGKNSKEHSFTCTSTHPVIALLFAMECANRDPESAVIYIALFEKVKDLIVEANVFKRVEREVVINATPKEFCVLSEGYVHYQEFKKIIEDMGFTVSGLVSLEKLTRLCTETQIMKVEDIETLVKRLESIIEKS